MKVEDLINSDRLIVVDGEYTDDTIEQAFSEGQSNPKIKQLEWEKFGKGEDLISKVLLGDYIISDNCSTYKLFINRVREGHLFFNLNDAKQYAQSDFEARVKECLIIE